jgi:pSer/pThr/pTyr-binding forkhead associated (FHA) protein
MAGPLTAVERFFERLFERPAARLFQAPIQKVQIQRGLERAIETDRDVRAGRAYVPAHYRVLLNQTDFDALDGDRAQMANELAESVRVYARSHGYVLSARPTVEVMPSNRVAHGDVRVYPRRAEEPSPAAQAPTQPPPADDELISQATAVFAAAQPNMPRAQIAVRIPGQPVSHIAVRPGTIRVGRSLDNDIVLPDEKVSRHHGQIGIRLGMLVYTDLGSTNGSFLNGANVSEIALGPGDVLQLGSSTLTVEPAS